LLCRRRGLADPRRHLCRSSGDALGNFLLTREGAHAPTLQVGLNDAGWGVHMFVASVRRDVRPFR
jgi:hypothetical protein